jgi:hypothetical protein
VNAGSGHAQQTDLRYGKSVKSVKSVSRSAGFPCTFRPNFVLAFNIRGSGELVSVGSSLVS